MPIHYLLASLIAAGLVGILSPRLGWFLMVVFITLDAAGGRYT